MPEISTLTLAASVCAICTLLATLAARPWKTESARLAGLPAVGLGLGFLLAILILLGLPDPIVPRATRWHWLFWTPVPVIVAGAIEALLGQRAVLRTILAIFTIIAALTLSGIGQVYPTYPNGWHGAAIAQWLGLPITISIGTTLLSGWVSGKFGARTVIASWLVMSFAVGGAAAFLSGFGSLGTASVMLAPAVVALAVMLFLFPKFTPGLTVWAGLSVLCAALVSAALEPWYGSMQVGHGVMLLLAPLGILAVFLADRTRWWTPPIVVALATIAIACWPIGETIASALNYYAEGYLPTWN